MNGITKINAETVEEILSLARDKASSLLGNDDAREAVIAFCDNANSDQNFCFENELFIVRSDFGVIKIIHKESYDTLAACLQERVLLGFPGDVEKVDASYLKARNFIADCFEAPMLVTTGYGMYPLYEIKDEQVVRHIDQYDGCSNFRTIVPNGYEISEEE